jgi:hypothetical protein
LEEEGMLSGTIDVGGDRGEEGVMTYLPLFFCLVLQLYNDHPLSDRIVVDELLDTDEKVPYLLPRRGQIDFASGRDFFRQFASSLPTTTHHQLRYAIMSSEPTTSALSNETPAPVSSSIATAAPSTEAPTTPTLPSADGSAKKLHPLKEASLPTMTSPPNQEIRVGVIKSLKPTPKVRC